MAKDSFILYKEQNEIFENLSDAQAGKLIKAIFKYANTDEEPELDEILRIAFIPIKQQLDRNEMKWVLAKQKRSEAGKKGMAVRWKDKNDDIEKSLQSQKKITNVINDITKITNITDNVNVNVNDNIKENIKRKVFVPPTLNEINSYISEKQLNVDGQHFYEYFMEGGWKDSKGNQVKNWKQKLLTWNKYSTMNSGIKKVEKKSNYEQRKYDSNELEKIYAN